MKIIFLCSCLEPGRDGVGDYTRRLAIELIKQGHMVSAIALNDKHVKTLSEEQSFKNINFPILRLPADLKSAEKIEFAQKWINSFNPNWISLQFVIYGFHSKGLPLGVTRFLFKLWEGKRWHIMFHELWIGMNIGSSNKDYFIGCVQKLLIKNLITVLKPSVIHTQTKFYQNQLGKMGFNSRYLPLFSNIPFLNKPLDKDKDELNTINMVVFGSIQPNSLIKTFASEASDYSKKRGIKIRFVFIGKCGNERDLWVSICKSEGFEVTILGEQPVEFISEVLQNSTIGISSNDITRIGKSGTIAAMIEHGLPVVCISKPWIPRESSDLKLSLPDGVMQYEYGKIELCLKTKKNQVQISNVEIVSKLFLSDLS
jgi:hypothetical protein